MLDILRSWIIDQGLDLPVADILARSLIFVLIIILSLIAYFVAKYFILKGLTAIINRTTTQWDDMMLKKKVFNRLAHLAPAMLVYMSISIPFEGYDWLIALINGLVLIFIIVMVVLALDAFLNATLAIYTTYEVSNRIPIKGFIQVLKLIIYFASAIFIISILVNKTPVVLFTSLGAVTAIMMFIFKDDQLRS